MPIENRILSLVNLEVSVAVDDKAIIKNAVFLTVLTLFFVPAVSILIDVSPFLPLVAAGLGYGAFLFATEEIAEGVIASIIVFVTVAADLPIVTVPVSGGPTPTLRIMLVDIVALPAIGLFLYHEGMPSRPRLSRRALVGYALAASVLWSFLSAVFGAGPSTTAGLIYATSNLHHLLLLLLGVGILRYTNLQTVIVSFLVSLSGHMVMATIESFRRQSFGLTHLGDAGGFGLSTFSMLSVYFESGTYAGGFVGNSRVLVSLVILFAPLVLLGMTKKLRKQHFASILVLLLCVFVIRISASDTALGAFIIEMAIAAVLLWYATPDSLSLRAFRPLSAVIGSLTVLIRLFQSRGETTSSDSSAGSTSSDAASGQPVEMSPALSWVGDKLPFISTDNLLVRLSQYAASIDVGFKYPLFGLGGHNFPLVSTEYGVQSLGIHNLYLSTLASAGFPSLLFLITSLTALLAVVSENYITFPSQRPLWAGVIAGLIGFYSFAFWVYMTGNPVTLNVFWLFVGTILGASSSRNEERPPST
jgi:hypothetical protein